MVWSVLQFLSNQSWMKFLWSFSCLVLIDFSVEKYYFDWKKYNAGCVRSFFWNWKGILKLTLLETFHSLCAGLQAGAGSVYI